MITYRENSVQDGGIDVILIDKGRLNTLQDIYYLLQFKGTRLADLQFSIIASEFNQIYLHHTFST